MPRSPANATPRGAVPLPTARDMSCVACEARRAGRRRSAARTFLGVKTPTVTAGNLSEFRCRFVHRRIPLTRCSTTRTCHFGIDPHLAHICTPFLRSDTALSRGLGGHGGLLCGNTFIGSSIKPISFLPLTLLVACVAVASLNPAATAARRRPQRRNAVQNGTSCSHRNFCSLAALTRTRSKAWGWEVNEIPEDFRLNRGPTYCKAPNPI